MTEGATDQQLIGQFQAYQQQLQTVYMQREQMKLQKLEIEKSIEELDASKEENAFKIVGPIMIKKPKEDLKKELKEHNDSLDLRSKTLDSAEERITKKLKEMESDIKRILESK